MRSMALVVAQMLMEATDFRPGHGRGLGRPLQARRAPRSTHGPPSISKRSTDHLDMICGEFDFSYKSRRQQPKPTSGSWAEQRPVAIEHILALDQRRKHLGYDHVDHVPILGGCHFLDERRCIGLGIHVVFFRYIDQIPIEDYAENDVRFGLYMADQLCVPGLPKHWKSFAKLLVK